MPFQPAFIAFWQKVVASIDNRTFAKLTLAKTIGDTELKNIYVRPIIAEDNSLQISVIARYKAQETECFCTLEDAFVILIEHINNPFLTAILFTIEGDVTFKLNKKRAATLLESNPTFKNASDVMLKLKQKESGNK